MSGLAKNISYNSSDKYVSKLSTYEENKILDSVFPSLTLAGISVLSGYNIEAKLSINLKVL